MISSVSRSGRRASLHPLAELSLLFLSSLLFILSHPNPIFEWGVGFLGFVALVPLFVVVWTTVPGRLPFYGFLTGFVAYTGFNYWLAAFHPLTIFVVPIIYAVYYALLFPAIRAAMALKPSWYPLITAVVWMGYEYLRTTGFLGYSYGILGYTQYLFLPLVNTSSIWGIWGVNALVLVPNLVLSWWFTRATTEANPEVRGSLKLWWTTSNLRVLTVPMIITGSVILAASLIGVLSQVDYSDGESLDFAVIQHNMDPKIGGLPTYRRSKEVLARETDKALQEDPDVVLWSETAFIPSIDYHTRYREDPDRYQLVDDLLDYLDSVPVPVIMGNGQREKQFEMGGRVSYYEYNAVLLMEQGEQTETYRKVHLVPFSEHFPYEDSLPWLYDLIQSTRAAHWRAGDEFTIFELPQYNLKFGTPICFEDTFGYISREMVNNGADLLVNVTNDSWSESVPAMVQHLAMAVFRSAETRRTTIRGTNGGYSAVIDPNGAITQTMEPFTVDNAVFTVPIYSDDAGTLYLQFGDWLGIISAILGLGLVAAGGIRSIVEKILRRKTASQ